MVPVPTKSIAGVEPSGVAAGVGSESTASFAIATEFQQLKYVGRSQTDWNMRVYDAGVELEERIRNDIAIAIKEIENKLGEPNK